MKSLILLAAALNAPAAACADPAAPSPTPIACVTHERPCVELHRLALCLERQACALRQEALARCPKAGLHPLLMEQARQVERLAIDIHRLVECEGRTDRVREALGRLDEQFRQLDRHIDELIRSGELDARASNRLPDALRDLRETLHRLQCEL
jgi:hypothetical protein